MCIGVHARLHPHLVQNADIRTLRVLSSPFALQLYAGYENEMRYSVILVHVKDLNPGVLYL